MPPEMNPSPASEPGPPAASIAPRGGRRRWWRLLRRVALLAAVLLLAAVGAIWLVVRRLEAEATLHAETGKSALALLTECQKGLAAPDLGDFLAQYADDFRSDDAAWSETLRSDHDEVEIRDWAVAASRPVGKSDLPALWGRYRARVAKFEEVKLKLDGIDEILGPDEAHIRSVLWVRGRGAKGEAIEDHLKFRMTIARVGGAWRVREQSLIGGETVVGKGSGFVNVTESSGLDFRARHNPDYQRPQWAPKKFGIMKYASAGVAAADYDGDGWIDVFFGDGAACRLYRNVGGGKFADATEAAGLPTDLRGVHVALFADLDNDGDPDLFLGRSTGPNKLFRNDGHGYFTDVTEGANLGRNWVATAAAADYDGDGKVDLYLGRYLDPRKNLPTTVFYTRNGEGNSLLHNEGGLSFRDATAKAGVGEGGLTLGVAWADIDSDGDVDLYVANDFGRNAMFRNDGDGKFTDVSRESGTLDIGYGMSAAFGDVDNDGDMDLYVANVHSSQRWYGQAPIMYRYIINSIKQGTIREDLPIYRELYAEVGADWKNLGKQVIKGNSLFLNDGRGKFAEVSERSNANPFGWFWSSVFLDYDNDGLQDIYAVNGWITGKIKDDL